MHSTLSIVALLAPGLLASPLLQRYANVTVLSSSSASATSSSTVDLSGFQSAMSELGAILTATPTAVSSSTSAAISSSSTSVASSTSSAPGYQTSQYTGSGGAGQNWGVEGPEKMLDWLADQCGDGECPGSLQYTGNDWPMPITGQSSGHMQLTIVSDYKNKSVLTDYYIPAFKAFFAQNQNSTKVPYDPYVGEVGPHPYMGPLPTNNIISAPGYFALRRYPADDPTAGHSDQLSITAQYESDDKLASFLCEAMIGLAGMTNEWIGFFGDLLEPVCDEL